MFNSTKIYSDFVSPCQGITDGNEQQNNSKPLNKSLLFDSLLQSILLMWLNLLSMLVVKMAEI